MFLKKIVFVSIFFSLVHAVDVDYYYSSGLRSQSLTCESRLKQLYCQIKCNMKPALCLQGNCFCISMEPANAKKPDKYKETSTVHSNGDKDFNKELYVDELTSSEIPYLTHNSLYALRPTVRHHIAHFCPNLDIARKCIRQCMEKGRPAFCGKDHVCYCGHKYVHTIKDQDGNAKEMYAQFKDLYDFYFQPNKDNNLKV